MALATQSKRRYRLIPKESPPLSFFMQKSESVIDFRWILYVSFELTIIIDSTTGLVLLTAGNYALTQQIHRIPSLFYD